MQHDRAARGQGGLGDAAAPSGRLVRIPLAIASRGVGSVLQLALTIYIGRAFTASDAGIYFIATGWVYVIAAAVSIGLPWHTMILVSGALATGDTARAAADLRRAVALAFRPALLATSLPVAAAGLFFLLRGHIPDALAIAATLGFLGSALAIQRICVESVKGTRRPVLGLLLDRSSIPAGILAVLLGAAAVQLPRTTATLIVALSLGYVLSAGVSAALALGLLPRAGGSASPIRPSRLTTQFLIQFSDELFSRMPLVLMPALLPLADAGGFGVAFTLTTIAGTTIYALYAHYGPVFAGLRELDDGPALRAAYRRSQLVAATTTLPLFAIFLLFGDQLLLLYGEPYTEYARVLRILAAGAFIPWTLGLANFYLSVCHHDRQSIAATTSAAVVFALGAVGLTPRLGPVGLAAAYAGASALRQVLSFIWVRASLAGGATHATPLRYAGTAGDGTADRHPARNQ